MKHLVLLDVGSATGKMYADADHPYLSSGATPHPILDCTDVDLSHHRFALLTHSLSHVGKSYQTLYIPYEHILQIVRYNEAEPAPLGFRPIKPEAAPPSPK